MKLKIYKRLIFLTYSPLVAYPQMISYAKKIWVKMDYCVVNIISLEVELLLLSRYWRYANNVNFNFWNFSDPIVEVNAVVRHFRQPWVLIRTIWQ